MHAARIRGQIEIGEYFSDNSLPLGNFTSFEACHSLIVSACHQMAGD